jgi:hypothetical protein
MISGASISSQSIWLKKSGYRIVGSGHKVVSLANEMVDLWGIPVVISRVSFSRSLIAQCFNKVINTGQRDYMRCWPWLTAAVGIGFINKDEMETRCG